MIIRIYILSKNEEANIERCLRSTTNLGIPITVLDSGSTDGTLDIVEKFDAVTVESYAYSSHCDAYNDITTRHTPSEVVVILDADMRIDETYTSAVDGAFARNGHLDAAFAPVTMFWLGRPLKHGNLYPPKAVALRGGRSHFEKAGHGERLVQGTNTTLIDAPIVHDDRRPYDIELVKQWRYAQTFARETSAGQASWKDRIRFWSPALIVATPLVTYLLRGGFLSGYAGAVYALDRLIAESIAHRAALLRRMQGSHDGASRRWRSPIGRRRSRP